MRADLSHDVATRSYKALFTIEERQLLFPEHEVRSAVFDKLTTILAQKIFEKVELTFKTEG